MSAPSAESLQQQVIVANQQFYREIASKYDDYEACASDGYFQRWIENDLESIARRLRPAERSVRCLDCGGGTGNLTVKMLARGWDVTVVDVSADMLTMLANKVKASGHQLRFVQDSVESFFDTSHDVFDVISFSSVLHHLYAPLQVVEAAASRVAPHGFFYSVFDPAIPSSRFTANVFSVIDTLIAKLLHDRHDLLPGMLRRVRKLFTPTDASHGREVVSPGDLAEYHARHGIDDRAIEATLAAAGFEVDRKRYAVGRSRPMRWLNRQIQALPNFRVLAQKQDPAPTQVLRPRPS